ncbi:MAG: hypothetical protein ACPLKQ_08675 [Candidatus Bathyarchaeales archaeon]
MGLEPEFMSDPLLKLYIAGGAIPYMRGSEKGTRLPCWNYTEEVEEALFHKFKLITPSATIGVKENRTYYWGLTEKGWEIGQKLFQQYLELKRSEVELVLTRFPRKVLSIVFLGCQEKGMLSFLAEPLKPKASVDEISSFLSKIELHVAPAFIDEATISRWLGIGFKKCLKSGEVIDRELKEVCENFPMVFAKFMVQHPVIVQLVEKLLGELVTRGVAVKIPEYGSKGQPLGEACKAPPEVLSMIWSSISGTDISKELSTFAVIYVFIKNLQKDFTIGRLRFFLGSLGISESLIENELELMHKEGATSKFLKSGDEDDPPFIVLNKEKYSEHLTLALNTLAHEIIEPE